jgi:hypothetical protein
MEELIQAIWKFIRGDLAAAEFEQWVYKIPQLEKLLGNSLYLDLRVCNYQKRNQVEKIKKALEFAVDQIMPRECDCLTWLDNQKIPMDINSRWEIFSAAFAILVKRTPWLECVRCNSCGQHWYIATDTIEDTYYLYRLGDEEASHILQKGSWPPVFNNLAAVWPNREWLEDYGFKSLQDWQERNKQ